MHVTFCPRKRLFADRMVNPSPGPSSIVEFGTDSLSVLFARWRKMAHNKHIINKAGYQTSELEYCHKTTKWHYMRRQILGYDFFFDQMFHDFLSLNFSSLIRFHLAKYLIEYRCTEQFGIFS